MSDESKSLWESDYTLFGLMIGSLIIAGILGIYLGRWNP